MKILVTGGAGYIGSHTSKLLKKAGHVPVVFDNLSNGWAEWVKFGPFAFGDIRDEEALFRVLTGFQIEAVIHFAAKAYVEESTRLPEVYFDNNVNGTINLAEGHETSRDQDAGFFQFLRHLRQCNDAHHTGRPSAGADQSRTASQN